MSKMANEVLYCEKCDTYYVTVCNCDDQDTSDIPEELVEMLSIFHGLPPHDGCPNIYRGDEYYMNSIEASYSKEQIHKATVLIIQPLQSDLRAAREAVMEKIEARVNA